MRCSRCGGYVEWKGPLSNLTHTECARCGGINCQEADTVEAIEAQERRVCPLDGISCDREDCYIDDACRADGHEH